MTDINTDDMVLDFVYQRAYAEGLKKGREIAAKVWSYLQKNPTASNATVALETQCTEEDVALVRKFFGI